MFRNTELKLYSPCRRDRGGVRRTLSPSWPTTRPTRRPTSSAPRWRRRRIGSGRDRQGRGPGTGELESDSRTASATRCSAAPSTCIGGLLGGRRSTRGILGGVRRASSSRRNLAATPRSESSQREEPAGREGRRTRGARPMPWPSRSRTPRTPGKTAAEKIETFEVGLEKTDITVEDLALVWVPASSRPPTTPWVCGFPTQCAIDHMVGPSALRRVIGSARIPRRLAATMKNETWELRPTDGRTRNVYARALSVN